MKYVTIEYEQQLVDLAETLQVKPINQSILLLEVMAQLALCTLVGGEEVLTT